MLERKDEFIKAIELPVFDQNLSLEYLAKFLSYRFLISLKILAKRLGEETSKNGTNLFDAWMSKLSDEIQLTSRCYGEMICVNSICEGRKSNFSMDIIKDTARLYALTILKDNLAWNMMNELLTKEQASMVAKAWSLAVSEFDQLAETWIEAFMIPEELIHAPIARDWVRYNQYDNFGEVIPHSKY